MHNDAEQLPLYQMNQSYDISYFSKCFFIASSYSGLALFESETVRFLFFILLPFRFRIVLRFLNGFEDSCGTGCGTFSSIFGVPGREEQFSRDKLSMLEME